MQSSYLKDFLNRGSDLDHLKTFYVFDTNYFLHSIEVSSLETSLKYLKALEKNKDNIFIPYIAYMEFILNLERVIGQTSNNLVYTTDMFEDIQSSLTNIFSDKEELINVLLQKVQINGNNHIKSITGGAKPQAPYLESLQKYLDDTINNIANEMLPFTETINQKLADVVSKINKPEELDHQKEYRDFIFEYLDSLDKFFVSNKVVGKEYTQKDLDKFDSIINDRFKNKRGPGYKDIQKDTKDNRTFGDLSWKPSHGDAILWLDILEKVKTLDENKYKRVVIVSSDSKSDWVSPPKSNKLKLDLIYEFKQHTGLIIQKVTNKEYIQDTLSDDTSDIIDNTDENEKGLISDNSVDDYDKKDQELLNITNQNYDTIVVPARSQGFHDVFIGQNEWYAVRIAAYRIPKLKYIAVYRTYPFSKITHIAPIKEIVPYEKDPTKKKIIFSEHAQPLKNPIILGSDPQAMQSARYTQFKEIQNSLTLDDLF